MIQPKKDELREWLAEARDEAKQQRRLRRAADYKLLLAKRKLGELVLEGKIAVSAERLGELVLEDLIEEEVQVSPLIRQKLIAR
ncbi:hypothetical protein LOC51_04025 [Rubrivivax sp. JA1024]|nr:hypothetical protein [Rubrivivax sp. JA1024]